MVFSFNKLSKKLMRNTSAEQERSSEGNSPHENPQINTRSTLKLTLKRAEYVAYDVRELPPSSKRSNHPPVSYQYPARATGPELEALFAPLNPRAAASQLSFEAASEDEDSVPQDKITVKKRDASTKLPKKKGWFSRTLNRSASSPSSATVEKDRKPAPPVHTTTRLKRSKAFRRPSGEPSSSGSRPATAEKEWKPAPPVHTTSGLKRNQQCHPTTVG